MTHILRIQIPANPIKWFLLFFHCLGQNMRAFKFSAGRNKACKISKYLYEIGLLRRLIEEYWGKFYTTLERGKLILHMVAKKRNPQKLSAWMMLLLFFLLNIWIWTTVNLHFYSFLWTCECINVFEDPTCWMSAHTLYRIGLYCEKKMLLYSGKITKRLKGFQLSFYGIVILFSWIIITAADLAAKNCADLLVAHNWSSEQGAQCQLWSRKRHHCLEDVSIDCKFRNP